MSTRSVYQRFSFVSLLIILGLLLSVSNQLTAAQPQTVMTAKSADVQFAPSPGFAVPEVLRSSISSYDTSVSDASADTPSGNIELVGQIGGVSSAVAIRGDLAYIGSGPRLVVLDISDPAHPSMVGESSVLQSVVRDVIVAGEYAYVLASELYVLSISDALYPTVVGATTGGAGYGEKLAVSDGFAYITDYFDGLRVVSVEDPTHPTPVGFVSLGGEGPTAVVVSGHYAYVSYSCSLLVYDISNRISPRQIAEVPYYGIRCYQAQDVALNGRYVFLVDFGGVYVFDALDPASPTLIGFYGEYWYPVGTGNAYNILVDEQYAYLLSRDSVDVIRISNPTQLVRVGSYQFIYTGTSPYGTRLAKRGAQVYVPDWLGGGMRVIDVGEPARPHQVAQFNTPGLVATIDTIDNYAYVDKPGGLQVVDASNSQRPNVIGSWVCGEPCTISDLVVDNNYVYLATELLGYGIIEGIEVVDVSDPQYPIKVTSTGREGDVLAITGHTMYVVEAFANHCNLVINDVTDPHIVREVASLAVPFPAGSFFSRVFADIAVVGDRAFMACDPGVYIVDVSSILHPTITTLVPISTSTDIKVAGNGTHLYIGEGRTVRIWDTSRPSYPSQIGTLDVGSTIYQLQISSSYLYAITQKGLVILDVSIPQQPVQSASYQSSAPWNDLAVSGNLIYVAARRQGLVILRWTPTPTPGYTISPIWPANHATSSTIMQGGVASRSFRLSDANGNPVPGATVTFSLGASAITDAAGNFTYTIQADTLGGPGTTQSVSVQSVSVGDQTYSTGDQPTFQVAVQERTYSHSWSYGAIRKASAGVNTGLIAYLRGRNQRRPGP